MVLAPYLGAAPGNFVAGLGNYWIDRTSKMLEFERTCQVPHARVYYELLCDEPGQTLSDILEALELSPDGSIISRTFTSDHGRGPGDYKIDYTESIRADSIGRGSTLPRMLAQNQIQRMNEMLGGDSTIRPSKPAGAATSAPSSACRAQSVWAWTTRK